MVQSGAEARYKDLAVWFGRPETPCYRFDPHTYPQGSFRPGTVVSGEEYDLDAVIAWCDGLAGQPEPPASPPAPFAEVPGPADRAP